MLHTLLYGCGPIQWCMESQEVTMTHWFGLPGAGEAADAAR